MVAIETGTERFTVADLIHQLGDIPANRIRIKPPIGTATEQDVIRLLDGPDKRPFELIDGVLVEKAVGAKESLLASWIAHVLWHYAEDNDLGVVLGADSPYRLRLGLVRFPDVSFISWDRLPRGELPDDPISKVIPDLTVEVMSASNTPAEIELKLDHYFKAGVRVAWIIDPKSEKARVYTSRSRMQEITGEDELTAGKVLPGFRLLIRDVFAAARRKKRKPR
jgi:Uma2 family endonuclease